MSAPFWTRYGGLPIIQGEKLGLIQDRIVLSTDTFCFCSVLGMKGGLNEFFSGAPSGSARCRSHDFDQGAQTQVPKANLETLTT